MPQASARHALTRHPESLGAAAIRIEVDVARPRADRLVLTFLLSGTRDEIRLPAPEAAARRDGLWQSTCFEAFLRAPPREAYYEFNFAPSTAWAAYRFDGYRRGMRRADDIEAAPIEVEAGSDRYVLRAVLDLAALAHAPPDAAWRLGLCAIIEDTAGAKSYWALAHPPGQPDFHHADGFVHALAPMVRA